MSADILEGVSTQPGTATSSISGSPLDGVGSSTTFVICIITVRIEVGDARALIDEARDVLQLESENTPGFLGGELLMSLDFKTLVIRTEWIDIHAWSKSRYDGHVGAMLEHCSAVTKALEVDVYQRHATFAAGGLSAE